MNDKSWVEQVSQQQKQAPEQEKSWVQKLGAGVGNFAKGLGNVVLDEVYHGAGPQGAHELASALNTGNAFVLYPRGKHDDGNGVHGPQQEQPQQQPQQQAQDGPEQQQQQQRGGRGM